MKDKQELPYVTPMALSTLLHKTKFCVHNLNPSEQIVLGFLLSHVDLTLQEGYKAFPSTERIEEYTGLSKTTIERARKKLLAAGWMKYRRGSGERTNNTYYINAQKIVDCAVASGEKRPAKPLAPSKEITDNKPRKNNNISGLKNQPVKEVVKEQQKEIYTPVPQAVPETTKPSKNPDGSDPFFPNGQRRYSWDDVMTSQDDGDTFDIPVAGDPVTLDDIPYWTEEDGPPGW